MEITLRIPDELARLLGTTGEIERRALEALALEEFKLGHLSRAELRRLLSFETGEALNGFLQAHEAIGRHKVAACEPAESTSSAPDETRRTKARRAAANIIARRKGVTLGGLKIKDLINEGRR
jgi:hypothetical protein